MWNGNIEGDRKSLARREGYRPVPHPGREKDETTDFRPYEFQPIQRNSQFEGRLAKLEAAGIRVLLERWWQCDVERGTYPSLRMNVARVEALVRKAD